MFRVVAALIHRSLSSSNHRRRGRSSLASSAYSPPFLVFVLLLLLATYFCKSSLAAVPCVDNIDAFPGSDEEFPIQGGKLSVVGFAATVSYVKNLPTSKFVAITLSSSATKECYKENKQHGMAWRAARYYYLLTSYVLSLLLRFL